MYVYVYICFLTQGSPYLTHFAHTRNLQDFSQVYPSFDLRRVNTLELAMLDALKYVIRVSASEYAKYYFHLRSMMARLGLYEGKR